jgi:signal transduction histidine kinase
MHAPREQGSFIAQIGIALGVFAVFCVDVMTPLGIAIWAFYLVALALTFMLSRPAAPLLAACVCTLAIIAGYFLSPPPLAGAAYWSSALNRGIGVIAVWSVALTGRYAIIARQRLFAQAWIRAGQRDLGARMQGELDRQALGERILQFLCEYLDAPVGVFYVEEGGALRQAAAYAADPGRSCPREVLHPGEGLLGQAVKSRRPLRLDHVPAGHLPVSSALGASPPRHVVAIPAIADGEVMAALELGFTRPLTDLDMDLLSTASEAIAVSVRSCLYRGRLEALLRETQRQADELQVQQEELRAANEEMESQRAALSASQAHLEEQQAALQRTNTELAEQTRAIERHRDQLLRAQAELVARSAELARASQYKSEFLANMSHELRTPLNSALILAKLLADNKDGNLTPEQVRFASTIYSSGHDLLTLINDILDLSRIESGRLDLALESVPLAAVLGPLQQMFQPIAAQKGLAFDIVLHPGAPAALRTDPMRLQQILRNLLANALKFTDKGKVTLRVVPIMKGGEGGDGGLAFAVEDTGEGIPGDKLEVIFEAFRQADGTTQRRHGGSGLGLTIARQLAHRLGGDISVVSEPGRGIADPRQDLTPAQIATSLDRIARQGGRMSGLLNELLDVFQLHAGRPLTLELRETDLVGLARTLAEEHQRAAPEHRIELRAAAEVLIGKWDAQRLERVVGNLLSNAIKYSPDGGAVRVDIEAVREGGAGWAVLRVQDEGIGIPAADQGRIFEWFVRGDNAERTAIQGTGIGLAGARQIVERHGGSIAVESEEGRGATFTVRLPMEPP